MSRNRNDLIGNLVIGLEPVRPLSHGGGLLIAALAAATSAALVVGLTGPRAGMVTGQFDPVFLMSSGLFLLLGVVASVTAIYMGRPRVGGDYSSWKWAVAMMALVPLSGLVAAAGPNAAAFGRDQAMIGMICLFFGLSSSVLLFIALAWWLRQGAPTSPERAGLVSGIAAGSIGIFAHSLYCSENDMVHIGLWHTLVVVLAALVGRTVIARMIRW